MDSVPMMVDVRPKSLALVLPGLQNMVEAARALREHPSA
jgi:hypothetical protein